MRTGDLLRVYLPTASTILNNKFYTHKIALSQPTNLYTAVVCSLCYEMNKFRPTGTTLF